MTKNEYYEQRKARHQAFKDALFQAIQAAERAGEAVNIPVLAARLGCTRNTLHVCRRELADAGLIAQAEQARLERIADKAIPPDLEERIAAVRAAKDRFWGLQRDELRNLSRAELKRVLPK